MKVWVFSVRTAKEILRDPVNLAFGLGFPLMLLGLLTLIQANVPVALFALPHLAPGLAVFGLSFLTLFSGTLLARDRESSFLRRLYTTPMQVWDFLLGYTIPLIPMALAQSMVCYLAAAVLGLELSVGIFRAVMMTVPVSLFFIAMGLLFGSVFTVKQAGSVCGALFTNLSAWLSGTWFDLDLVGGTFRNIAYALPFVHAVNLEEKVLAVQWQSIGNDLAWVLMYDLVAIVLAALLFLRQSKKT